MAKEKEIMEVVKFDVETQVIVALDTKYKDIQITDGKSYALVMAGIGEYRDLRLAVGAGHKEAKEDINKKGRWLDSEKRRILARLAPGEEHLKGIRQAWDDEKERIKKEKADKEQQRKDDIRAKITQIAMMQSGLQTMGLIELRGLSDRLEEMEVRDGFHEFTDEAENTLDQSYDAVQTAIAARIKLNNEAEERKAEDARLETVRKKQKVAQAKIDAAQKKIDDDKAQFEDEKKQAALEKAATEKAEAAAAQKLKEAASAAEERAKTAAAEKERKAAMAPDREKLYTFTNQFDEDHLDIPKLKAKKAQEILKGALEELFIIGNSIRRKADDL